MAKFYPTFVFDEEKFPPLTYVLQSARATIENNLFRIEGILYYRGRQDELEDVMGRFSPGLVLDRSIVGIIRRGNFGMPHVDKKISDYFIVSANVSRIGLQIDDPKEGVKGIPMEVYEVSFSAVAAPYFASLDYSSGNAILSESMVQKKFADSYNARVSTTTGSGASNFSIVTRQISFDYIVRNKTVELYFAGKSGGDAEQLLKILSDRFPPELVPQRDTGRVFYNYVNINGYNMGADFRNNKSATEFTPILSLSIQHVCGEVKKATFEAVAEFQREGA
jgi:hypothetical protein